ncbi:hypothetical protein SAMN05518672_11213 [Chitinophaga sp. CF118]|uniref:hypothetical protein n=1 Tax=Chitinophaga sp. CF118 TaxID=1884367 RepID=UPI0008DEE423|nr:hypothetical protein [Chitinophaga sp. CF118]SFE90951.1 hypothetical protein SAMN05518672_11213 [Chitinophaga sp. CF118]
MNKHIYILLFFLAGGLNTYAQLQRSTILHSTDGKGDILLFPRGVQQSSGNISYMLARDSGNTYAFIPLIKDANYHTDKIIIPKKPFLQVHGNIMYDLYYQSGVDTPYQQKDVYQHTLQTYLDITVKDQYPFRIGFSTTRGNSSMFRNITGLNLQYTNRDFKGMLLDKIQRYEAGRIGKLDELKQYRLQMDMKALEISKLRGWMSSPAQLQKLVEERERKLYKIDKDSLHQPNFDSLSLLKKVDLNALLHGKIPDKKLPSDSSHFEELYAAKGRQLDSLQKEWDKMDLQYRQQQKKYGNGKDELESAVMNSRNNKELADKLHAMGLPDTVLPKGYKTLLAIKSFGIGRTMVNYSELTAKDISIQGIQVEYNPSYYVAVASGVIDYRFRNYIVNSDRPKQYLNLFRVGMGMKEGNNLIFTYYTGKKQLYNLNTTDSAHSPDYRMMGMALEGRWELTKNIYVTGEVAKSSLPYYRPESKLSSLFHFNDRSNEAYAVKAFSFIPLTGTKINAVYKVMGESFQSFSMYTTGSAQTAWSVRVDQPFFKQQLTIAASIRQNDYTSQYQQAEYKSNTIFKSIQATLRIKKWPVLSVGYFPSSQLTKLSDNSYTENLFYTLVGSLTHFYKYAGITMNTTLSYTQFYNRQTDSNFVYFNTKNILLDQVMFLGRWSIQGTVSAALNSEYDLYGADGNAQYRFNSWLDAGAGLKYSKQTVYNIQQIGYTGNMRINIPHLGQIELMADKGFIPGAEKRLISNNTGRVTYTKIF